MIVESTSQVDLHCHTEFSVDGYGSPERFAERAKQRGLAAFSLTEHNSLASTARAAAAARKLGIRFLPGVELDLFWDEGRRRDHFLCFGFDPENQAFARFVAQSNKAYLTQMEWVYAQIEARGQSVDRDAYHKWLERTFPVNPQTSLWRLAPYLAQTGVFPAADPLAELWEMGPLPWPVPTLDEALCVVRQAKGLLLMAHPCRVGGMLPDLALLRMLLERGLVDGFEMYHKSQPEQLGDFWALQKEFDVAISGGSDCHSLDVPNAAFGVYPAVPADVLATMQSAYRRRYSKDLPLV